MFFGGERFTTVDIGSYGIKVARMQRKKSSLNLLTTGYRQLPFATIKEGKINDPSVVADLLDEIFKEMKYKPDKIISTIPSNNLIIRSMELPPLTEEEIAEAIKWEAEDYLPFPVEAAVMDYIVFNRDEEGIDILLVATKKEIIDNFLSPFKKLALKPSVINVQPMALLSLLDYQGKAGEPLAIIDIGASSTRVIIGDQNNIYLSRSINTGGGEFTRFLMEEMEMEFQQAEEYKRENGLKEESNEVEELYDLVLPQLNSTGKERNDSFLLSIARNLANEISRSLEYYSMKYRGDTVNKIYLTGGGSRLKRLADIISRQINQELSPINPYEGFVLSSVNEDMRAEFAVAIGLGVSEVLSNAG